MSIARALVAVLHRVSAIGAGSSLAAMFAVIFLNSLRRYTIGKSFEWGEELPIYLGIYGMMLGAAVAYLQDRHIRFTVVIDLLPSAVTRRVFVAVDALVAVTGAALAYSGYLFVLRRGGVEAAGLIGRMRAAANATGQNWLEVFGHTAFWQSAMILGGMLICLAGIVKFVERVRAPEYNEWYSSSSS